MRRSGLEPALPRAALATAVLLYAAAATYAASLSTFLAVAMVAVGVLVAWTWDDISRITVLAVPGVWLITRIPGLDVSVTDALVTAAGVAALLAGVARSLQPPARLLFGAFGFYLLTLSVTVLVNHSIRSDLEVFHRIGLVGGGLLAGALLVRQGKEHHALRALLAVTVVVSAVAIMDAVQSGFQPSFPLGYHKNFLGSIAATTLVTLLAAGRHFRLPRGLLVASSVVVALGLAASQSRAGMLAVALGVMLWFARVDGERRRRHWKVFVVLGGIFAAIALSSVSTQLDQQDAGEQNSITQRLEVEAATQLLWQEKPLTGVGVRFFDLPEFVGYQPPNNVLNEILAEAGFPGLIGFLVFAAGSILALWRCQGDLAVAGLCVVAARFAHGLVDIYWTGGTTTLPWLIAGMGLAALAVPQQGPSSGRHRAVTPASSG